MSGSWDEIHFWAFLGYSKRKSQVLQSKESSNQKMKENKLALKFNSYTCLCDALVMYQECHQALMSKRRGNESK